MLNRLFVCFAALSELRCTDFFGKEILNGQDFQPKSDPCYQCSCSDGFPTMCKSVSCNPPTDCHKPVMIKGTCCQFSCMDNGGGQGIFPTTNSTDPTNKNKDDGEDFIAFTVILDANEFLKKLLSFKHNGVVCIGIKEMLDEILCNDK